MLPFLSEALYQNLVRAVDPDAPESVHLTGYPTVEARDWRLEAGRPSSSLQPLVSSLLLVRAVQNAGLALADRIALHLALPGDARQTAALLDEWGAYVQSETLAETLTLGTPPANVYIESATLDGAPLTIGLARR